MFLFKEKPKTKLTTGILISLIGVLVVILRPLFENSVQVELIGNLFFVISTLGFVIYTLLLKEIAKKYPPVVIAFWTFLFAAIYTLPFVFIESRNLNFIIGIGWQGWIGVGFGVIFSLAIAYTLYAYILKFIPADEAGIFLYVDPIASILVAIPLLGEKLTISFILGSILVFFGIFIAEGRIHYHPVHRFSKSP